MSDCPSCGRFDFKKARARLREITAYGENFRLYEAEDLVKNACDEIERLATECDTLKETNKRLDELNAALDATCVSQFLQLERLRARQQLADTVVDLTEVAFWAPSWDALPPDFGNRLEKSLMELRAYDEVNNEN